MGYRLIICEVFTGIIANLDGGQMVHEKEEDFPIFTDLTAAKEARDKFLARVPWCEAWIKNLVTGEISERALSPHYPEYKKQYVEWCRWRDTMLLMRLFKKKPQTPLLVTQQMGIK